MKEGLKSKDFNKINEVAIFMGPIFDLYRVISLEELRTLMEGKERFLLIDVRDPYAYENEHITGARNIPLDSIEREASKFLKEEDLIVVYGVGSAETAVSADKFATLGYERLLRYEGGIEEWKGAGLSTEGLMVKKAA